MRRYAAALAAALTAATLSPTAHAAGGVVTAIGNAFAPADVTITQGSTLTFANADLAPHNVTAQAYTSKGPLFASTTVTQGQQAEVKGTDKLPPSTYTFICSIHPTMHGTLTVTAPGSTTYALTPTGANVATPTSITIHEGALYAASYAAGTVTKFTILPGGALAGGTPYATGFDSPLGLAFAPDGTLYVADSHAAGSRRQGRVWAVKPDGTKTAVIDGLPNGRHNTNGMEVHGNRLYVANGNATDDGVSGGPEELPLNGTVLSWALPIRKGAKPKVHARGLRNPYDLAFRPGTNEVWFASNGPDALDPYGEDLLHRVDATRSTADYGFPRCVYDASLKPKDGRGCRAGAKPIKALGLHVSADGLAFGWGGALFIAEYGSNDPSLAGHRVVRIDPRTLGSQDVVVGPAPIDVAFGADGLYMADFDSGVISLVRAV